MLVPTSKRKSSSEYLVLTATLINNGIRFSLLQTSSMNEIRLQYDKLMTLHVFGIAGLNLYIEKYVNIIFMRTKL